MRETYKVQLFLPLAFIVVIISFFAVAANFYIQKNTIIEQKLSSVTTYNSRFDTLIESQAGITQAYLDILLKNEKIKEKFLQNDREALYEARKNI